jgi:hypothetical protein
MSELEELELELGAITFEIDSAETEEQRKSLEDIYFEKINTIVNRIETLNK